MAAISYWCLSPTVLLALLGKLKGFDRTRPTPAFDWRSAKVDVLIPARDEEATISLCLASLFQQDFPIRKVAVIDDGSADRTAQAVTRFCELTGEHVDLVIRTGSIGKTPGVREQCRLSDADAVIVLDADTVLTHRNYISRVIEELFKNAGVASACGEVMPWTRRRRRAMVMKNPLVRTVLDEMKIAVPASPSLWRGFLEFCTVIYRSALYLFLQRVLYDGHLKMFGSRLSPIGCAVAYRTARLRECFDYAAPRMGDNLSNSEDVFIGHFFNWKGYRNVQVTGVSCESLEPTVDGLPRQLYLWSSSFLQAQYYFKDLPLSFYRQIKDIFRGRRNRAPKSENRRLIQEQYRQPWGEDYTRRHGRGLGWIDLLSMFEKVSYPVILILLAIFYPWAALFTIAFDMAFSTVGVFVVADPGTRFRSAAMMVAATPIRLLSLGVDLIAVLKYLVDLATGNRKWRK